MNSFGRFLNYVENPGEKFEVITRDGEKRLLSFGELSARMGENSRGMKLQGQRMVKDSEGTESLEELAKKNPELARFAAIGQWCLDALREIGICTGEDVLRNVKSIDRDNPSPNSETEVGKTRLNFSDGAEVLQFSIKFKYISLFTYFYVHSYGLR